MVEGMVAAAIYGRANVVLVPLASAARCLDVAERLSK